MTTTTTTANTSDLKNKLAEKAQAQPPKALTPEQKIHHYLEKMGPQIAKALPKHLTPDRMARIALTTIRTNPKLLECKIESLMAAVMQASQLGLEPGLLGHCYFVPYKTECQFIIGYKGMIDLARRSGDIQSINVHEVYENDYFVLKYGLEEQLEHIPYHIREDASFIDSGKVKGAYLVAKFKDGGHYIHYMPINEIEKHKERSMARNSGPWVTDYIEMVKKTVVRSAWKWLPISIEVAEKVVANDETVKTEIKENMSESENMVSADYEVVEETSYEGTPFEEANQ